MSAAAATMQGISAVVAGRKRRRWLWWWLWWLVLVAVVVSGECHRNGCGGRRLRGAGVLVGARGSVGVPLAVDRGCGLGEMGWQGGGARGNAGGGRGEGRGESRERRKGSGGPRE
jgi:hypothetical protein